ncbi:uncharacterized protein BX663DRAFT_342224 [Cokeromyces recurvatus]|uniref:uncharacterized protein n=1 Tax=Cokeromyces recurvatus TaxID=90255 RepID=UPI00221E892F|nr:uncharacterized protein BX663DRAFT_342224 [Cokeromyces recurvatus]KAI7904425.1 hypothetical protein BX663DRAFT_342224 [Cokeromyces recurvatus]
MTATTLTENVFNNANVALETLSNLWYTMLQIIQAVSSASASSLTVEPDLAKLQKTRKEYEQLKNSFRKTVEWLESNKLKDEELEKETEKYKDSLNEQEKLQKEQLRVNDQLKRLLNQTYAMQFQIEMLFASCQDIQIN